MSGQPSKHKITGSFRLTWAIDAEGPSYAAAAAEIWRTVFGRDGQPGPDEACVFTVEEPGATVVIDLSDEKYAHLF